MEDDKYNDIDLKFTDKSAKREESPDFGGSAGERRIGQGLDGCTGEASEMAERENEAEDISAVPDADALVIPESDDDPAEAALGSLAYDAVEAHYTFINLAAILIVFLTIGMTLFLIREGKRYSTDNVMLNMQTFADGSYTQSLSNRYIGESKLGGLASKLGGLLRYAYGINGESLKEKPEQGPIDAEGSETQTQTVTNPQGEPVITTTPVSSEVVINPEITGISVTMPSVTITLQSGFTGVIKHTSTSMTSSFTSTAPFVPTATTTSGESSETTPPESTPTGSEPPTTPEEQIPTDETTTPAPPTVTTTPVQTPPEETPVTTPAQTSFEQIPLTADGQ